MAKSSRKPSAAKKHAEIEDLSLFALRARFGAVGLHLYAEDFYTLANAAAPANAPFAPARYYLVCRSIELALKAYLSLKGHRLSTLAGGSYGHDLAVLLDAADGDGLAALVTLSNADRDEIRLASKYYVEKVFEYPALTEAIIRYPHQPNINTLLGASNKLVYALRDPCRAA